MAEVITPRLMAAAKEFNIGKDTLVDFLVSKGFSKDDLKPTSKLTEDMYRFLLQEFQGDKVAKIKSDQIDLPKGSLEAKKKKEDETVLFKKEIVKKTEGENGVEPKAAPEEQPVEAVLPEPPPENEIPQEKEIKEPVVVEEAPQEVPVIVESHPGLQPEEVVAPEPEKEIPQEAPVAEEQDAPPVIENIKAEKLEGPKILGKIELPLNNDTRPKPPAEEKRKRKRIPIEKKDNGGGGGRPNNPPGGGTGHGGTGHSGGGKH